MILFFNLFIDLKIKNCIKFAFKSRVKNERWLKVVDEQKSFIEYNVFEWFKFKKHFIAKKITHFICFHNEFYWKKYRHFRITIDYHHNRIVYNEFSFVRKQLRDHIHNYFFYNLNDVNNLFNFLYNLWWCVLIRWHIAQLLTYFSMFFFMYFQ